MKKSILKLIIKEEINKFQLRKNTGHAIDKIKIAKQKVKDMAKRHEIELIKKICLV